MPGRPDTIVLASGNAGKLAEIVRILEDLDITVSSGNPARTFKSSSAIPSAKYS